jgi:hypothetical protein
MSSRRYLGPRLGEAHRALHIDGQELVTCRREVGQTRGLVVVISVDAHVRNVASFDRLSPGALAVVVIGHVGAHDVVPGEDYQVGLLSVEEKTLCSSSQVPVIGHFEYARCYGHIRRIKAEGYSNVSRFFTVREYHPFCKRRRFCGLIFLREALRTKQKVRDADFVDPQ